MTTVGTLVLTAYVKLLSLAAAVKTS